MMSTMNNGQAPPHMMNNNDSEAAATWQELWMLEQEMQTLLAGQQQQEVTMDTDDYGDDKTAQLQQQPQRWLQQGLGSLRGIAQQNNNYNHMEQRQGVAKPMPMPHIQQAIAPGPPAPTDTTMTIPNNHTDDSLAFSNMYNHNNNMTSSGQHPNMPPPAWGDATTTTTTTTWQTPGQSATPFATAAAAGTIITNDSLSDIPLSHNKGGIAWVAQQLGPEGVDLVIRLFK